MKKKAIHSLMKIRILAILNTRNMDIRNDVHPDCPTRKKKAVKNKSYAKD